MTSKTFIAALCSIALILGIFLGYLFTLLMEIGNEFFKIGLKDILSVSVPIIIALFITYYINEKNHNENKKKELVLNLLNDIDNGMRQLVELGYSYIESSSSAKQKEILNNFKKISLQLNLLFHIKRNTGYNCMPEFEKMIKNYYFVYKKALTDNPFKLKLPTYSEEQIRTYEVASNNLLSKIHEAKLQLYC